MNLMPKKLVRALQISVISIFLWIGFNLVFNYHINPLTGAIKGISNILSFSQTSQVQIQKGVKVFTKSGVNFENIAVFKQKDGKFRAYLTTFRNKGGESLVTAVSSDGISFENTYQSKFPSSAVRIFPFSPGYRIYYLLNNAIYSAYSPDGVNFGQGSLTTVQSQAGSTSIRVGTIFQIDNGSYKIFFTENAGGKDSIWSASSGNGIKFTRDQKPVLEPVVSENGVSGPSVVKLNGKYFLFYSSGGVETTGSKLMWAQSADGLKFERRGPLDLFGSNPDAIVQTDGSVRLYYDEYNPEGEIYSVVLPQEMFK